MSGPFRTATDAALARNRAAQRATRLVLREMQKNPDGIEGEEPFETAGDRMSVVTTAEGTTITFDEKGTGRVCGGCTLCCKLLPIPALGKLANERCRHQTIKGCKLHGTGHKPGECKLFACLWLADRSTAKLKRPDRTHYVIDVDRDEIRTRNNFTEEFTIVSAVQIWVDPAFADAWRQDEDLKDWMLAKCRSEGVAFIMRFNTTDAEVVFPPPTDEDQWRIVDRRGIPRPLFEKAIAPLKPIMKA